MKHEDLDQKKPFKKEKKKERTLHTIILLLFSKHFQTAITSSLSRILFGITNPTVIPVEKLD